MGCFFFSGSGLLPTHSLVVVAIVKAHVWRQLSEFGHQGYI